jgi:hypothetical protein
MLVCRCFIETVVSNLESLEKVRLQRQREDFRELNGPIP